MDPTPAEISNDDHPRSDPSADQAVVILVCLCTRGAQAGGAGRCAACGGPAAAPDHLGCCSFECYAGLDEGLLSFCLLHSRYY